MFCQVINRNLKMPPISPIYTRHSLCWTQSVSKKPKWKRRKDIYVEIKGDLLYGIQPVTLALQAGRRQIYNVFYNERSSRTHKILQICQDKGINCQQMATYSLDTLLTHSSRYKEHTVHQGVLADVSRLYHTPLDYKIPQLDIGGLQAHENNLEAGEEHKHGEDLNHLKIIEDNEEHSDVPVWLLLCSVKDPMNLGSILRTAYFLGVERVIVTGDRCKLSSAVSKSSSGVMEIFPLFALRNPAQFLQEKVAEGWHVLGTTLPAKTHKLTVKQIAETKLERPTILVMGSEGDGIPTEVMNCLNLGVYIPPGRNLHTEVDSLNVAVATSILLHNLIPPIKNKSDKK